VIIIFIETAVDLVGRGDRTKDLTSKNYDENLCSENSASTLFGEDCDKEEFNCPWVADGRLSKNHYDIVATIKVAEG
jgi:hypothetical protein